MKSIDTHGRLSIGLALAWSLLLLPTAQADEVCSRAQGVIAATELAPAVEVFSDWDAFVESKPSDKPFTVGQYASAPLEDGSGINTVLSCKMRTSERINSAYGSPERPVAGPESSCDEVHRHLLAETLASIPANELKLPAEQWVVEAEDTTFIGPRWLDPWPFVAVTREDDGKLHLYTRALYAPHSWWMPMPERFLGNYYCHLAHPDYIRALATGEVSVP